MTTRELLSDEEWGKVTALAGEVIVTACVSDGHLMPGVRELKAGVAVARAHLSREEYRQLREVPPTSARRRRPARNRTGAAAAARGWAFRGGIIHKPPPKGPRVAAHPPPATR